MLRVLYEDYLLTLCIIAGFDVLMSEDRAVAECMVASEFFMACQTSFRRCQDAVSSPPQCLLY
jgi:hypothetical protein